MVTRRFNPPDLTNAIRQSLGSYELALVYRYITNDKGPTVHLFGPVSGEICEIIRFDCFENEPHFHLGISYLDKPIVNIESSEPLSWVLNELEEHLPNYLERSNANNELPEDWSSVVRQATQSFKAKAASWQ